MAPGYSVPMAPSHPTTRRLATSAASAPLTRRTMLGSALALAGASALGCAGRGQRPGAGQTYDVTERSPLGQHRAGPAAGNWDGW